MANITRLKSGNYRALVRMRGTVRSKTFPSKTLAKTWAASFEAALLSKEAGIYVPKTATLGDLIRAYQSEVRIDSASTVRIYNRILTQQLSRVRIRDLNASHVDCYIAAALKTAKPSTVAVYLSLLGKVASWARAVKYIDFPPRLFQDAIKRMSFNGHRISVTMDQVQPGDLLCAPLPFRSKFSEADAYGRTDPVLVLSNDLEIKPYEWFDARKRVTDEHWHTLRLQRTSGTRLPSYTQHANMEVIVAR